VAGAFKEIQKEGVPFGCFVFKYYADFENPQQTDYQHTGVQR